MTNETPRLDSQGQLVDARRASPYLPAGKQNEEFIRNIQVSTINNQLANSH